MPIPEPTHLVGVEKACPRCESTDTKWRYYNNRSKVGDTQPRYHCNACDRQFTYAGSFRRSPQGPLARRAAEATAKNVAEQAALDAAALEVARRIARKAEKAARKVERAGRRTARWIAKRAAKRAARNPVHMVSEESLDGSRSGMVRHHASPAASSDAEMMVSGENREMKSSEGVPGSLMFGDVAPVGDGVHVMEHVGVVWDETLGHNSLDLELWVGEEAEDVPALSLPEIWETSVDGAENDSGLRSLDDLWAEYGGDIDSGLQLLATSCEVESAEVDTGLATFTNGGSGEFVDSGVAGSEVQWTGLVSASAGSDEERELIVSMLSQHEDIDSGLEWMSDPCHDESEPDGCGLRGFEMWMDCGSAESEAELDWTDLVIMGMEMEGFTL